MAVPSFPLIAALASSAVFCTAGFVQLLGLEFVRRSYRRREFPPKFYRVPGALELIAGLFLSTPNTRVWGVALAELIAFVAVVMHLKHRRYGWSVPGILMMAALPQALLVATV